MRWMKWMDELEADIGALNEKLRAAGIPRGSGTRGSNCVAMVAGPAARRRMIR